MGFLNKQNILYVGTLFSHEGTQSGGSEKHGDPRKSSYSRIFILLEPLFCNGVSVAGHLRRMFLHWTCQVVLESFVYFGPREKKTGSPDVA